MTDIRVPIDHQRARIDATVALALALSAYADVHPPIPAGVLARMANGIIDNPRRLLDALADAGVLRVTRSDA